MNGQIFEETIGKDLRRLFPCCVLSNIPIFRPDMPEDYLRGYEIDHLLHIKTDMINQLIIIECKAQNITGRDSNTPPNQNGPWNVWYRENGVDRPKDVKKQLYNHAKALNSYLLPLSESTPLSFESWTISEQYNGQPLKELRDNRIVFRLFSVNNFNEELKRIKQECQPLRIEQSALLGEIRKGMPVYDMGHPELRNALTYVARCRNAIDKELFSVFKPSEQRWAINGSAGMGKSVVLAYCLFVFASNRIVKADVSFEGQTQLQDFSARANDIGLPTHENRVIYAVARRAKQIKVLEQLWDKFVSQFSGLDNVNISFNRPIFKLWDGTIEDDCNLLIVDEAHDLEPMHQRTITDWLNVNETRRYLVIACDRHQKLRLISRDATMIEGLNFSGHTKKLTRNYRNPFSVYAASLSLMFRWFANDGVKVIPTKEELKDEFGLNVETFNEQPGAQVQLSLWNDSHPGNYWSFTISSFPSCEAAYNLLSSFELKKEELLWVRFGVEDEFFDYEKLSDFTYHNCYNDEAMNIVDKYIKGQEFPIVVIEGFPAGINTNTQPQNEPDDSEKKMWEARRMIYLCCSRSTAFLYFVYKPSLRNDDPMTNEVDTLIASLSQPENPATITKREWKIKFQWPTTRRRIENIINFDIDSGGIKSSQKIVFEKPITVKDLSIKLNVHPSDLNDYFQTAGFKFKSIYDIVPDNIVRDIVMKKGFIAVIQESKTQINIEAPTVQVKFPATPPIATSSQPIIEYINSPAFNSLNTVVEKYLNIIAKIISSKPEICAYLEQYPSRGRIYFDKNENRISLSLKDGGYGSSSVQKIPSTEYYAFVGTDTPTKRRILNNIMEQAGYSREVREQVLNKLS